MTGEAITSPTTNEGGDVMPPFPASTTGTAGSSLPSKPPSTNQNPATFALLSLGNDLSNEAEDVKEVGENGKKRKLDSTQQTPNLSNGYVVNGVSYDFPQDFWYWASPQTLGEWDVLCGRGGESNNNVGNKNYRKYIKSRKDEYRKIDPKNRKQKTNFVRDCVQHIINCGGRFLDVDQTKQYYVVTMEKARKKTSQALRETKELKWLDTETKGKKKGISAKDVVCPYCKKTGHKSRIAKACAFHHQWLDAGRSKETDLAASAESQTDEKSNVVHKNGTKDHRISKHHAPSESIAGQESGGNEEN